VKFSSGERFPMLLDSSTGIPEFEPTLFSLEILRARNSASKTIEAVLRAIVLLYVWAKTAEIDLNSRFKSGDFLSQQEIESLVRASKQFIVDIAPLEITAESSPKIIQLLHRNKKLKKSSEKNVAGQTSMNRMLYIRKYFEWHGIELLSKVSVNDPKYPLLKSKRDDFIEAIKFRTPLSRSKPSNREGVTAEVLDLLLRVTKPDSVDNPWRKGDVRIRNRLIILAFLQLGIRRGELLGAQISQMNFVKNEIKICRIPDNIKDPRQDEPNTKTRARILPVGAYLAELFLHYITRIRNKNEHAKTHDFLFTATDTGEPLKKSSITKMFIVLREKVSGLSSDLSAHVMRHTWNELFSDEMDAGGISGEDENKVRSFLMGWSETSGMAATYTRRHTKRKAKETSLKLQARLKPIE
jgi:integrase